MFPNFLEKKTSQAFKTSHWASEDLLVPKESPMMWPEGAKTCIMQTWIYSTQNQDVNSRAAKPKF